MRNFWQKAAAFRAHSRLVIKWAAAVWWHYLSQLLFASVFASAVSLAIGYFFHNQLNIRFPSFQQTAGQPMSEVVIFFCYVLTPAAIIGLFAFGFFYLIAPSQIQLEREDSDEANRKRLLAEVVAAKADFEVKDRRSQEALSSQELRFKGIIGDLEQRIGQLQAENATLRDSHEFRNALSISEPQPEDNGEGTMTVFKLEVRNNDSHRTVEDTCVRVMKIESCDGEDVAAKSGGLLTITETDGHMPCTPGEVRRDLVASNSIIFDFLKVTKPPGGHIICYGECVLLQKPEFGNVLWKRTPYGGCQPGRHRVVVEAQGKNVKTVRKTFEFWGDDSGIHCTEVFQGTSAQ